MSKDPTLSSLARGRGGGGEGRDEGEREDGGVKERDN